MLIYDESVEVVDTELESGKGQASTPWRTQSPSEDLRPVHTGSGVGLLEELHLNPCVESNKTREEPQRNTGSLSSNNFSVMAEDAEDADYSQINRNRGPPQGSSSGRPASRRMVSGKTSAAENPDSGKPLLPPASPENRDDVPQDSDEEDEEDEYNNDMSTAQIEGHQDKDSSSHSSGSYYAAGDYDVSECSQTYAFEHVEETGGEAEESFSQTFYALQHPSQYFAALESIPANSLPSHPIPVPSHSGEDEESFDFLVRKRFHEHMLDQERQRMRLRTNVQTGGIHRRGYGVYDPSDYEGLNATTGMQDLFQYITMYSPPPPTALIEVKVRPFIPEYYPSVGEIDAFLKVIHPEIKDDGLGEAVLDEPCAFQSDPSVLDLRLRAMAKQNSARAVVVKKVENTGKNTKIIENWIKDISDLHRSKPSPSIHYSKLKCRHEKWEECGKIVDFKPMPDIELLLQEWPNEFEKSLKKLTLPLPDLDCDLKTYVDLICNLFDIPVYKSRIQSLHLLAVLYSTHRNFGNYGPPRAGRSTTLRQRRDNVDGRLLTPASLEDGIDRLELE